MPKYDVAVEVTLRGTFTIEADNKSIACIIAGGKVHPIPDGLLPFEKSNGWDVRVTPKLIIEEPVKRIPRRRKVSAGSRPVVRTLRRKRKLNTNGSTNGNNS